MQTITKILSGIAIVAILFSSCQKDYATPTPIPAALTTLQKIQANWTYEKDVYHEFWGGIHYRDTMMGAAGDYLDFRTDNKAYLKIGADRDTLAYSLYGDNKLITIDNSGYTDTLDIPVLNANEFQLYLKTNYLADYFEFTVFLKK